MKMSNLKRNLIKILEQNDYADFCVLSSLTKCEGINCSECPFDDEEKFSDLIDELKNNYVCQCRKCGAKFSATHTNCPSCNAIESVRLL